MSTSIQKTGTPESFVVRCAWLLNPRKVPRQNMRVSVQNGVVAEISPVPADEMSLVRPIALVPAFVNAHTHLEFSQLTQPLLPPQPFPDWIRAVIAYRQQADSIQQSIVSGYAESLTSGTTLLGEITTSDAGYDSLCTAVTEHTSMAISFREILGLSFATVDTQLAMARRHLSLSDTDKPANNTQLICGLSPHAPYSVHPDLFAATTELAAQRACPLATHLGETTAELQLLSDGSGPFVDFLQSVNLWDSGTIRRGTSLLEYLRHLKNIPHALAIHCNYLTSQEIRFLADHRNITVVYCPRTHAWFNHDSHPWIKLRNANARVILGTDSRASNPDLSIWKELLFLARQHSAPPLPELLAMITTDAASALGQRADAFTICEGQLLTANAVRCQAESQTALTQALLSSPGEVISVRACAE